MLARACGKTDVHSLEPEDLCALTVEAAAMAKVPLAGTDYIPGVTEQETLDEIKTHDAEVPRRHRAVPGAEAERSGDDVTEPHLSTKIGIDAEELAGRRFPYQEDIALVEDSTSTR